MTNHLEPLQVKDLHFLCCRLILRNHIRWLLMVYIHFFTPDGVRVSMILFLKLTGFWILRVQESMRLGLVLTGINGDAGFDQIYYDLSQDYFAADTGIAYYKHLCGEYYTSTSFALWLGSVILESQIIPPVVQLKPPQGKRIK